MDYEGYTFVFFFYQNITNIFLLKCDVYSYLRHSESLGVLGQSTEFVKKKIKQSMHFVNLNFVL